MRKSLNQRLLEMRIYLKYLRKTIMNTIEIIILFIGSIFSIVGLFLGYIEDKQKARKLAAIGIVLIVISFGLTLWDWNQQGIIDAAKSNSGEISSRSNDILYPCICMASAKMCNVKNAVQLNNDPISVRIENGKLIVSAKVRDETGKIMGEIINNSFISYPPYALKNRHDDNGWEVIDPYGRVAIQVDLIGSCAQVAGIFYSMDGNGVMIFPKEGAFIIAGGPSNQLRDNVSRLWESRPDIIPPLFDYSSDEYPSKRLRN